MNREPPGFCLLSKTGIARGLAWYLPDSYLCVLLDGHHKATAAALEGRPLKTLVLSTATHFNDEQQTLVFPGGECLHKTELQYHIPKLTACKTLSPSAWESFGPDKHISPSETWSGPLTFRLIAQNRTPQADAFFLDFAINDDGERPELTKIMDDYFRKP